MAREQTVSPTVDKARVSHVEIKTGFQTSILKWYVCGSRVAVKVGICNSKVVLKTDLLRPKKHIN